MLIIFILLISLTISGGGGLINAKPIESANDDPEYTAGGFEGDMMLNAAQKLALLNPLQARNGLIAVSKRWPKKTVVYKITGDFNNVQRAAIDNTIARLEARTCVRFVEAGVNEQVYLAITSKPGGCFTAVGYQGKVQEMNLQSYPVGEGCFRAGTIAHEFMHALGFYHEQSAADRDDYVRIVNENIIPGKQFNFKKYSSSVVTDFGVGYDYESCLHYRSIAFSVNGEDTIVPLNPNAQIGQRNGLSKKDIDKINVMYKCPIKV